MSLQSDAERISLGQDLNRIFAQATSGINNLKQQKADILALKNKVTNDSVLYSTEDLADVNSVIAELATALNTI